MGTREPWLTRDDRAGTTAGLVTEQGRIPWRDLVRRARELAAELPTGVAGWVVPADRTDRTVLGVLALGLADPAPSWVLGDPARWAVPGVAPYAGLLYPISTGATLPDDGTPTYATATSGSTGRPRLLFGRPHRFTAVVDQYVAGLPEFGSAEVFATCLQLDFAAAFYLMLLPAMVLGRDLVLFRPGDWALAARELAGRGGVCLAPPALQVLGARLAGGSTDYRRTSFVPAGGGLTVRRAERIVSGFRGCRFLVLLGSTEAGLVTATRVVRDDGYVGMPLPGKPVWLSDVADDGVGTVWTRGPDTRFAVIGGELMTGEDGAVSAGDLAHRALSGGYVLDGRRIDLLKVDGVSVYPNRIAAAVRGLPGVEDVLVTVDRRGALDRLVVVVVGDSDEDQVRAACASLPEPVVPQQVICRPSNEDAYTERGKVRL